MSRRLNCNPAAAPLAQYGLPTCHAASIRSLVVRAICAPKEGIDLGRKEIDMAPELEQLPSQR